MQIWIALVFLIMASFFMSENQNRANVSLKNAEYDAITSNMVIYGSAVAVYMESHAGAAGVIPDASLTLPSWYVHMYGINNYVTAGKAYVYYTGKPDIVAFFANKTESTTVGTKRGGVLVNPNWGQTSIVLPATIPDGAVVYAPSGS
jgi:hypothetical protein